MAKKICCICGKEFNGYGNNPEPVMPGTDSHGKENCCCDWCNLWVVLAARTDNEININWARENSDPTFSFTECMEHLAESGELDF